MRKLSAILGFCLALVASWGYAADAIDQRNIERLANGGPSTIKNVSSSIYNTGSTNREVLDVVAEVLLNGYRAGGANRVDAMAWAAKALGQSGDARYRPVLEEVIAQTPHRKLKKHAKKALRGVGKDKAKPYKKGTVSLKSLRAKTAKAAKSANASSHRPRSSSGKKIAISEIREGMAMQEVYDLVGQPTATYAHQTGKAWNPFNYGARDVARTVALYKGQGRIVFSLVSAYSGVYRVVEVELDPTESGYP